MANKQIFNTYDLTPARSKQLVADVTASLESALMMKLDSRDVIDYCDHVFTHELDDGKRTVSHFNKFVKEDVQDVYSLQSGG